MLEHLIPGGAKQGLEAAMDMGADDDEIRIQFHRGLGEGPPAAIGGDTHLANLRMGRLEAFELMARVGGVEAERLILGLGLLRGVIQGVQEEEFGLLQLG